LDTTLDFYPGVEGEGDGYPIAFAQDEGLPCTPGVEPIAGFLGSLSLDYSTDWLSVPAINQPTNQPTNQPISQQYLPK
jgi:hypothetical protein